MVRLQRSTAIGCAALLMGTFMPAIADEYVTNLGPVGPSEPIIAAFGGQRVVAFFVPERGSCAVHTFMWKDGGADAPYSTSTSGSDGSLRRPPHVDEPTLWRRRLHTSNRGPGRAAYSVGC